MDSQRVGCSAGQPGELQEGQKAVPTESQKNPINLLGRGAFPASQLCRHGIKLRAWRHFRPVMFGARLLMFGARPLVFGAHSVMFGAGPQLRVEGLETWQR